MNIVWLYRYEWIESEYDGETYLRYVSVLRHYAPSSLGRDRLRQNPNSLVEQQGSTYG